MLKYLRRQTTSNQYMSESDTAHSLPHARGYLSAEMQLSTPDYVAMGYPSDPKEIHQMLRPKGQENANDA